MLTELLSFMTPETMIAMIKDIDSIADFGGEADSRLKPMIVKALVANVGQDEAAEMLKEAEIEA
jgi:hypothetical protein